MYMYVASLYTPCLWCSVCFCTGHFVMVPINLTFPHCLHFFFEHLFHLYYVFFCRSFLLSFSFLNNISPLFRQIHSKQHTKFPNTRKHVYLCNESLMLLFLLSKITMNIECLILISFWWDIFKHWLYFSLQLQYPATLSGVKLEFHLTQN